MPPRRRATAENEQADVPQGDADPGVRLDVYEQHDTPWGGPYGKTNHGLTEDEVRKLAEREGTLREDGRPKATVFWDDVEGARVAAERERIEAIQFENKGDNVEPDEGKGFDRAKPAEDGEAKE